MERVCIRYPLEIYRRVRQLAGERKVSESDMWRLLVLRGLDLESSIITGVQVETLCLLRRLTATVDIKLLDTAKNDAGKLMAILGVTDAQASRQEP